jgi:hypothetical protein
MGFKIKRKNMIFSDLEGTFNTKKNRSKDTLMNLKATIVWDRVESILLDG